MKGKTILQRGVLVWFSTMFAGTAWHLAEARILGNADFSEAVAMFIYILFISLPVLVMTSFLLLPCSKVIGKGRMFIALTGVCFLINLFSILIYKSAFGSSVWNFTLFGPYTITSFFMIWLVNRDWIKTKTTIKAEKTDMIRFSK